MRARLVEALDSTGLAKQVVRRAGAETVRLQRVRAGFKFEPFVRHDQMKEPGRAADRAIAIEHLQLRFYLAGKPHSAAVATAADLHSTVTDLARLRG